nr:hypothetical protein [Nesterenkonia alba]
MTLTLSETATLASSATAMEGTFLGDLQAWVDGLPEALQWLGIIALSAIPFLESYTGGLLGVLIGMPFWAALASAVAGNTISVAVLVYGAHGIRSAVLKRQEPKEYSPRQQARRDKAKRLLDKFGVPGVSILGPFALPSQFTAPLMVSFGASRHWVMLWMFISIILWGAGFALLGVGLIHLLGA